MVWCVQLLNCLDRLQYEMELLPTVLQHFQPHPELGLLQNDVTAVEVLFAQQVVAPEAQR